MSDDRIVVNDYGGRFMDFQSDILEEKRGQWERDDYIRIQLDLEDNHTPFELQVGCWAEDIDIERYLTHEQLDTLILLLQTAKAKSEEQS